MKQVISMNIGRQGVVGVLFLLVLFVCSSCVTNKQLILLQEKDQKKPHKTFVDSKHASVPEADTVRVGDYVQVRITKLVIGENLIQMSSLDPRMNATVSHPYTDALMVDGQGNISIPGFDDIQISGLSVIEAKERVEEEVKKSLPESSVQFLLLSHSVTILGEVASPGKVYLYDHQTSILEVMAMVGGLSEFADREHVKIVRSAKNGEVSEVIHVDLTDRSLLELGHYYPKAGDIIIVSPLSRKAIAYNRVPAVASTITALVALTSLLLTLSNASR